MWTYRAERLVDAEAGAVWAAIDRVASTLWGSRARTLTGSGGNDRTDAVATTPGSDEPDVWLTWQLLPVGTSTRVRLVLDEVEPGPDPTAGLDDVLRLLAEHISRGHERHASATPD